MPWRNFGMKRIILVLVPALLLVVSAVAFAQGNSTVMTRHDAKLGMYLTDAKGMTLYRLASDKPNKSTCTGECLKEWPAFTASGKLTLPPGVPGKLGTITRADGTKQVTYNEMPLYFFFKDKKAGDITGQGQDKFFIVTPAAAGTPVASPAASPSASPNPSPTEDSYSY
jgi:predicted lipoprotein with Yx(FWY)xxD motif